MTDKIKDEDTLAIERVLGGDDNAFEILVKKYQKRIYFLALRMTKSHDIADELAQESFVKAYISLSSFHKGKSFYTWLYRITVNLVLNYLKHAKFSVSLDTPSGRTFLENIPKSPDQLNILVSAEQMEVFQGALDSLPQAQKAIFMLRVYDEFSYDKISEIMGCSVGTVMSRLFRARTKLKNALLETEKKENGKLQK
ncbi:MAG: sigma-70 family RNA polymerase sigma factor [candidate division Zixibacteria bacterium]|nr:sigma-70 family RNA polymerase sigma factor [candidate division Zixibacteria bacterium]